MLFIAGLALAAPTQHGRSLSYAQILAYNPGSQVTDHSNIDLDQKAIESELSTYDWAAATALYTTGAHSKPTAECTLVSPTTLGQAVAKKDAVSFDTNHGDSTTGKAYAAYEATATKVLFTYPVSESRVQPATTACYVGGLAAADQKTDGCIATGTGSGVAAGESQFTIAGTTYTATCTNRGKRTLQGFSTKAKAVMNDCPVDTSVSYPNGCPYTSYKPYYDYYGVYDYANQIVLAALGGTETPSFTNGGVNFAGAADVARREYIKKGTAYMNAWMYAIREFEDAIDDCTSGDLTSNALSSGPVHAWDEGVGFYVGSLMVYDDLLAGNLPTLDKKGKLAYTLGNKRCKNFKTCGPDGDATVGEAKANIELFDLFRDGQHELLAGNCEKIPAIKDLIVSKMTVPLVQGTLRYAYKMAALSGGDKEKAEGGIFAAAVLPQLHKCDVAAAKTVNDNMNLNAAGSVDFTAVKAAFEGCYASMGITCKDVGGLWKGDQYYADNGFDASPCVDAATTAAATQDTLIAIIVGVVVVVVLVLIMLCMVRREKKGTPIFKPAGVTAAAA